MSLVHWQFSVVQFLIQVPFLLAEELLMSNNQRSGYSVCYWEWTQTLATLLTLQSLSTPRMLSYQLPSRRNEKVFHHSVPKQVDKFSKILKKPQGGPVELFEAEEKCLSQEFQRWKTVSDITLSHSALAAQIWGFAGRVSVEDWPCKKKRVFPRTEWV